MKTKVTAAAVDAGPLPATRQVTETQARRREQTKGGFLFLPRRLTRSGFLKWLRRTHAWFGLWGAALGLLFGVTGFLLNHRAVLKIPAAKMEERRIQLQLPTPAPDNAQALAVF